MERSFVHHEFQAVVMVHGHLAIAGLMEIANLAETQTGHLTRLVVGPTFQDVGHLTGLRYVTTR
jgi:hypothetical protein